MQSFPLGMRLIGLVLIAALAACSTTEKRKDSLAPAVDRYNEMIRWKRPELAQPYVDPDVLTTWRDWSETYAEDIELQEWRVRQINWVSPVTATVEVERKGFPVRRLIQETWRIEQTWIDVGEGTWKLHEGF
jgi:hypothetical protein